MSLLRWARDHLTALAIGASLLVAAASILYAQHQAGQAREAELALDRQEALADSTRLALVSSVQWLTERAHTWQRRAVQEDLDQTETEEELGVDPRARTRIEIGIPDIEATDILGGGPVEEEGATRSASLHYRERPVTVDVTARLPPPPDTATWDVSVAVDAIHAQLTVGCGEAPEGRSIRPATANLTVPDWVEVRLSEVRQEPSVCNPVDRGWLLGWDPPAWVEVGAGLVVGFELGRRF